MLGTTDGCLLQKYMLDTTDGSLIQQMDTLYNGWILATMNGYCTHLRGGAALGDGEVEGAVRELLVRVAEFFLQDVG